jgi:hypothetical protein
MSFTNENEFQPKTLVTLMFNVRAFPSCVVLTCSFYHGTGHELNSYPYRSNQVLPSNPLFFVPFFHNQSSILVPMSAINITPVILNISDLTTNPLILLVPTQEVVNSNNVVIYSKVFLL